MLNERAGLAFEQDGWFQTFHSVPYVLGDVYSIQAILMTQNK